VQTRYTLVPDAYYVQWETT